MIQHFSQFLERLLLALLAGLSVFAAAAALRFMLRYPMPWYAFLLVALLVGGYVLAAWRIGGSLRSERSFLIAIALFFLASRITWITLVPGAQVSDFAIYEDLARQIAVAAPLSERFEAGYLLRLYSLGYPAVLAIFYRLFGSSIALAKGVNLLFGLVSLGLVYWIARQMATPRAARLAALAFALWPAQLAFSSVLASEHLAALLALAALAAIFPTLHSGKLPVWRLVATGLFFALGAATRNTSLIIFLAVLIALLLFSPLKFYPRLYAAGLLVVVFVAASALFREIIHTLVNIYPTSTSAFSLMVGTNYKAGGTWNYEDIELIQSYPDIETAKEFAWQEGLRRITRRPERFLSLMLHKAISLWQDDGYSIYWSTQNLDLEQFRWEPWTFIRRFVTVSQAFHTGIWLLAASAALYLLRRPDARWSVIAMTLLGSTLMHTVLEVQNRYAYWLMPLVFILAAVGWAEFFERRTDAPSPGAGQAPSSEAEG